MAGLALPLVWFLVKAGRWRDAGWLVAVFLSAELLLQALKYSFHRHRPEPFFGIAAPESYSFPSGHALMSTVFYVLLASLLTRNPVIRGAAIGVAILIGISRIYLGVHYPTDVLAGYAAAVFWLSGCHLLRERLRLES